jgi:hypothetical protein
MRNLTSRLVLLCAAALFTIGLWAGVAEAAPAMQDADITIVGQVDVAGSDDPTCPVCNLALDMDDTTYAATNPLPSFDVRVLMNGAEVDTITTSAAGDAIQIATFTGMELLDGESYTIEVVGDPSGWLGCFNDSPSKTLTIDDFDLGGARVDFFFYVDTECPGGGAEPTATATVGPTSTPVLPTVTPGGPTVTPMPTSEEPTAMPGDDDDDDDDDDKADDGDHPGRHKDFSRSFGSPASALGSIRGVSFIDHNGNGQIDAGEPGLNDVGVRIQGGGLDKTYLTDGTGMYGWDGLGPGEYHVFIEPGSEWTITTPQRYLVSINGGITQGIDFGLTRGAAMAGGTGGRLIGATPRLPATGIADLPTVPLLGTLAALLAGLAMVGLAVERRRRS